MKLFKCAFLGIVAILFCGCGESGGEFDAINVGKMNVVYENGILKITESNALNSSLGASFALGGNFEESTDSSLVLSPKFPPNTKSPPQNTRIFDLDSANQTQNAESALDSVDSQNLAKNNSVRSTQNSPASWCEKSESKGAEVPPADFLLEAEKRGSPPKSEKRQLLARRGSEVGGAALLRKESGEISGNGIAESSTESQSGLPRRFCESAHNDEFLKSLRDAEFADSAPQDFILFFFTSTCGVCKAQLPILEQLSVQGIKIYAILGDVPDISKASEFVRAHKISLPLFYESGARRFFTSAVGGVKGVPVMVIFKDGKMKEKFIGLTPKGTLLRAV